MSDAAALMPLAAERPKPWYALYTCSRYEKVVDQMLEKRGFETYLPLTTRRTRVSLRRFREATIPLFPGYVFCRFSAWTEDFYRVREIRGVVHVVSGDAGPVSLPDDEIESIRKLQEHGIPCIESRSFAMGQRVVVTDGPLKGLRGEVIRQKHRDLFVVKVQLIKRMLEVAFDPVDLQIALV